MEGEFGDRRRLQFVAELCREFGISRETGYKIFDRYKECGVQGLTDRSQASLSVCPSTSLPGGKLYPEREAGAHQLGRP